MVCAGERSGAPLDERHLRTRKVEVGAGVWARFLLRDAGVFAAVGCGTRLLDDWYGAMVHGWQAGSRSGAPRRAARTVSSDSKFVHLRAGGS